jgi:hypothetical protein
MFDARDCMFWWGAQLGMVALELGPLGTYAKISAGGDTLGGSSDRRVEMLSINVRLKLI